MRLSRRRAVAALAAGLVVPFVARAQQRGKVYRVGCIPAGPIAPRAHQWDAFKSGLRELGWIEGKNIILEFRVPQKEGGAYDDLVADLLRSRVDAIVLTGSRAALAAKKQTSTIPIVITGTGNPVGDGVVASLARPGGNITGLSIISVDLSGKRVELIREIVPGVSRMGVLVAPGGEPEVQTLREVVGRLGIAVVEALFTGAGDLDGAFDAIVREKPHAIYVPSTVAAFGLRSRISDLAAKHRVPAIYTLPSYANSGGLIAYGPSDTENYRRSAVLLDKILKGANPAEMPFEQPTRIELIVNLKSAKASGINIPRSLLIRADQVIE